MWKPISKPSRPSNLDAAGRQYSRGRRYNPVGSLTRNREETDLAGFDDLTEFVDITKTNWIVPVTVISVVVGVMIAKKR